MLEQLHLLVLFIIIFCLFKDPRRDAKQLAMYLLCISLMIFWFNNNLNKEIFTALEIVSICIGAWYATSLVRNIKLAKYTIRHRDGIAGRM